MADYLDGYQTVPDSGGTLPTPCGTEEANEGKAKGGNKWAKRKFATGSAAYEQEDR
jgi:hypothetical protein